MTAAKRTPEPPTPPAAAPTPAAQFRRAGLWRLPASGYTVRLRWPGLSALALAAEVSNPIAQSLRRFLAVAPASGETPGDEALLAQWRERATSFLAVAERCLDEPRLILDRPPDYDRGEIGPGDLPEPDIIWLWVWAQEGPGDVRVAPFRVEDGATQP